MATSKSTPTSSPTRPSPGISRIDQPSRRTHGYFVRVGYRRTPNGYRPTLTAFFGDATHGGKKQAWEESETWLKKARRQLAAAGKKGTGAKAAAKKAPAKKSVRAKSGAKKSGGKSGTRKATARGSRRG